MIISLIVISLAFTWLLYESDWMRVRLPVGAISKPDKIIKLWKFKENGTLGITNCESYAAENNKYSMYYWDKKRVMQFSVGITEPVCGWDWILNHEHPIIENTISITAYNCKHTVHLCDNPEVDYGRIMKEVCQVAFKANIRRNGHKPKRSKGLTFNPYYTLSKPKRRTKKC